jgi:hypothetical protein
MPDTPEHRANMFRLGQQRRAEGKPMWDRTIDVSDVFHNKDLTFEANRDAIVKRLRESSWLKQANKFGPLAWVVDNLAEAENTSEFNDWWYQLYDHADYDRVHISTF